MVEQQFGENLAEQVEVSSTVDKFIDSYLNNNTSGLLVQTFEGDSL